MTDFELNVQMAKFIGWKWDDQVAISPSGFRHMRHYDSPDPWGWLPDYCNDMGAAWQIVKKMREISTDDFEMRSKDGMYQVSFGSWTEHACSDRAAKAICLAALKWHSLEEWKLKDNSPFPPF